MDNWGLMLGCVTYTLFPNSVSTESYDQRLAQFSAKYMNEEGSEWQNTLELQSLNSIHFTPMDQQASPVAPISTNLIWIAITVGLLILLMACFNFVNLSLAANTEKRLEVSIRKVIGANFSQIWGLHLGELYYPV